MCAAILFGQSTLGEGWPLAFPALDLSRSRAKTIYSRKKSRLRSGLRGNHSALLEHRFEFIFERSRRNSELAKSRQVARGRGVDLHQLDLIAGEGRARQDLSEPGSCIP
jgi:hypothetical protein